MEQDKEAMGLCGKNSHYQLYRLDTFVDDNLVGKWNSDLRKNKGLNLLKFVKIVNFIFCIF